MNIFPQTYTSKYSVGSGVRSSGGNFDALVVESSFIFSESLPEDDILSNSESPPMYLSLKNTCGRVNVPVCVCAWACV